MMAGWSSKDTALRRLLHNDGEVLRGGSDSLRAGGEHFFVAPGERLFVQGPHVPFDARGHHNFEPARTVRCAGKNPRGWIDPEPGRTLLQSKGGVFDVKVAAHLLAVLHAGAQVSKGSVRACLIPVFFADFGLHWRLAV